MADLKTVIGLLYRADWTRFSLSATVRSERDGDLARRRVDAVRPAWFRPRSAGDNVPDEEQGGYHTGRAALLIAPGRRYRLEYLDDRVGDTEGSDGEHGWTRWRPGQAPPWQSQPEASDKPPFPELLRPAVLLSGFTLDVRGPVTACGREGIAVAATLRRDTEYWLISRLRLPDYVEIIVDAELGIALRSEETFQGQRLMLAELTEVTVSPPEAADPARFEPPPGSRVSQRASEAMRETSSEPGWPLKTTMGLAAGGLGALIRFGPHQAGRDAAGPDDLEAAMPSPEPGPLDPGDRSLPADDLLYLLYRSGEAPVLNATVHQWNDLAVMIAQGFGTVGDAGCGGVGYLVDSMKRHQPPVHMVARLRIGGPDRYRADYQARTDRGGLTTIACDGEHRWHVYPDQIMVGPAAPLRRDLAVGASWLLTCQLGGGPEITYHGRRAFQLRVTHGHDFPLAGPLLSFPADAIVDAETGCLLRLISYAGDQTVSWWELRDISTEPGDPGEFRVPVPPGVRVVEETGNPFTDATAVMPGVTGNAVRTAAEVVRRTSGAVSAARSFLDDLRGRTPPPAAG